MAKLGKLTIRQYSLLSQARLGLQTLRLRAYAVILL